MSKSVLSLIEKVDGFTYGVKSRDLFDLIAHDGITTIGYVSKTIAEYFAKEGGVGVDFDATTITIDNSYDTMEKRNQLFETIGDKWKQMPEFEHDLKHGWRNELYTVYNPTSEPYLLVERAFSVLLGVVTYGVHINGYVPPEKSTSGKLELWIPRRSATKPTYPGMLDNTVAGGLGYPYGLWETVVKECNEEAGLESQFVESSCKSAGVVSYMYHPQNAIDRVQPEVEYIYDLCFDDDVIPHPQDGEAEDFQLLDVDTVLTKLEDGQFKPNCGLVIIDFLIRHGYITSDTEPNYLEIQSRCHRKMPFPTM